jgi:DNA-binding MarR family transcriptional regulator
MEALPFHGAAHGVFVALASHTSSRENEVQPVVAEIEATCACSNVRKAARAVTQLFDAVLQPTGLRSTQFTLLVAVALLGEAPVTQLSRALVMDRTTLARNLKPLESLELLTVYAGTDRRRHLVRLTERGRQALARALPHWEQAQHQVVTRLGQEQWHALRASLKATMTLAQSV